MSQIFISYRRDDVPGYATAIYNKLRQYYSERRLFMDIDAIRPGEDFVNVIAEAISSCAIFILLIGPNWLNITDENGNRRLDDPNDFVRIEIAEALKRNISVIPVLLHGATMPSGDDLPVEIKMLYRKQAISVGSRFDADVDRLYARIDEVIKKQPEIKLRVFRRKARKIYLWMIVVIFVSTVGWVLYSKNITKISLPTIVMSETPVLYDKVTNIPTLSPYSLVETTDVPIGTALPTITNTVAILNTYTPSSIAASLDETGEIYGVVVDYETQEPLSGIEVLLFKGYQSTYRCDRDDSQLITSDTTNYNGEFRFENLSAGSYHWGAVGVPTHINNFLCGVFELKDGKTQYVKIQLLAK
jgi:hypothetical protein